jgi:hypothetical protein
MAIEQLNRATRRKLQKQNKITKEQMNAILKYQSQKAEIMDIQFNTLTEGTKVKLKSEQILSQKIETTEEYKQFVRDNIDTIFSIVYAEGKKDNPTLFELEVDGVKNIWLWHIDDLEVILNEEYIDELVSSIV